MKKMILLGLTTMAVMGSGVSVFGNDAVIAQGQKSFSKKIVMGDKKVEGFGIRMHHISNVSFDWAVEKGLINQETADKISAFSESRAEIMKAEMERIMNMSEEEREASFGETKIIRKDLFEQLVNEGIVTQSEADALKAENPMRHTKNIMFRGINVEALVKDGVISQSSADKIEEFLSKKAEDMKAEIEAKMAENNELADGEADKDIVITRKAFGNKDMIKIDLFEELVTNGIITQDEADAIKAAMPERPETPAIPEA